MSARNIFTLMQAVGNLEPLTIAFPKFHEFQRAKKGVLFTVFLPLRPCLNGKILVSCITGNGGLKICARCPILANCLSNIRYTRTSGSHRSRSHRRCQLTSAQSLIHCHTEMLRTERITVGIQFDFPQKSPQAPVQTSQKLRIFTRQRSEPPQHVQTKPCQSTQCNERKH